MLMSDLHAEMMLEHVYGISGTSSRAYAFSESSIDNLGLESFEEFKQFTQILVFAEPWLVLKDGQELLASFDNLVEAVAYAYERQVQDMISEYTLEEAGIPGEATLRKFHQTFCQKSSNSPLFN